jgi:hypothetical protein
MEALGDAWLKGGWILEIAQCDKIFDIFVFRAYKGQGSWFKVIMYLEKLGMWSWFQWYPTFSNRPSGSTVIALTPRAYNWPGFLLLFY